MNYDKFIPKMSRSVAGKSSNDGCLFFMDTDNSNRLTSVNEEGEFTVYCECNGLNWMSNLSQLGTAAPTLSGTVTNSNLALPTLSRSGVGQYEVLFATNVFSVSYNHYFKPHQAKAGMVYAARLSQDTMIIETRDFTGAFSDNILDKTCVQFEVIAPK